MGQRTAAVRAYPIRRRQVSVDLSVPKEMGGPGKPNTATPEHLFAAGYAACFGGALDFIAKQHKKDASKATVKCAVSIGPREKGGFGLAVVLDVTDTSCPGGTPVASGRGARKDLPLQPRDARQCRRQGRHPRGVISGLVDFSKARTLRRKDGTSTPPALFAGRQSKLKSCRLDNDPEALTFTLSPWFFERRFRIVGVSRPLFAAEGFPSR